MRTGAAVPSQPWAAAAVTGGAVTGGRRDGGAGRRRDRPGRAERVGAGPGDAGGRYAVGEAFLTLAGRGLHQQ